MKSATQSTEGKMSKRNCAACTNWNQVSKYTGHCAIVGHHTKHLEECADGFEANHSGPVKIQVGIQAWAIR